ncbi:structural protein [Rhodococcus phage E3]|uniref:structural protein n=1 Tax=Rhodococcus phage E3 TaxID=1007869 RepID=UPI0002C6DC04|nr:structural protein [Rhodococcus phage E3]AEQ21020.1 structural protein [Rhodococcus phage E3]
MPSLYPGANDTFNVPTNSSGTPLSSPGDSSRNHTESHRDHGDAIVKLQENAAVKGHDHSGEGPRPTPKLKQANTHENADTDTVGGIHHTLGPGSTQAAPGNHKHNYNSGDIIGAPYLICTSTTRPVAPILGMKIFETDTNQVRTWMRIPPDTEPKWRLTTDGLVPYVKARQTRAQSIPPNGSIVEWHTEIEDACGNFNPTDSKTNFNVTESGIYRVDAVYGFPVLGVASAIGIGIRVNGLMRPADPQDVWKSISAMAGHIQNFQYSGEVRANAGDRINVWFGQNAFLAQNSSSDNAQGCRVTIQYVRP